MSEPSKEAKAYLEGTFERCECHGYMSEYYVSDCDTCTARLFDQHTASLREQIVDLHLVAQGVRHYDGCCKNAVRTAEHVDECLRCQVESLRARLSRADDLADAVGRLGVFCGGHSCGTVDNHMPALLDALRAYRELSAQPARTDTKGER